MVAKPVGSFVADLLICAIDGVTAGEPLSVLDGINVGGEADASVGRDAGSFVANVLSRAMDGIPACW